MENINIELISDKSEFVMIRESLKQASYIHVLESTINTWITQSQHIRNGTVNPWISPYLNVRDQLNYGLMLLMNELQAIKSIMGGPSRGRENKTTNIVVNLAKAKANQASSLKA